MLRYNCSGQVRLMNVGVAEHRQATHEHMSNVDINGQARSQTQAHELSGSLTLCEDAQNESENKAFIQAFHRIQSVKSTNRVMLCYTRAKSSQCVNVGVAEQRQATPRTCNYTSNVERWV